MIKLTLTGLDEQTNLNWVREISNRYPSIEWGILLCSTGNSNFSTNRYPSVDWLNANLPKISDLNISLHACGAEARKLLNRDKDSIALNFIKYVKRIQINGEIKNPDQLNDLCIEYPSIVFITQENKRQNQAVKDITAKNHQVLFDSSDGRGIYVNDWQEPLAGKVCGYAGGIDSNNIKEVFKNVYQVVGHNNFWLDMESGIRNNADCFDQELCERVIFNYFELIDIIQ